MPSYGLIVEGDTDKSVFENLVRKINSLDAEIYSFPCGGVSYLMREFPALLRRFEHIHLGGPVDGALVIRDADNKPIDQLRARMAEKLRNRTYNFPRGIELCCVNRKLDTWLLADESAINIVSEKRGGKQISRVNDTLEDIVSPKERLQKLLSDAKLNYSPAVLGEIAYHMDLKQLEYRVRSFQDFKQSVLRIWGSA